MDSNPLPPPPQEEQTLDSLQDPQGSVDNSASVPSSSLLPKTSQVESSVQFANSKMTPQMWSIFVNQIGSSMYSESDEILSKAQLTQMAGILKMSPSDPLFKSLSSTIVFIFQMCIFHSVPYKTKTNTNPIPSKLHKTLKYIGLKPALSQILVQYWIESGSTIDSFFQKTQFTPNSITGINWELNIQMTTDKISVINQPLAKILFKTVDEDDPNSTLVQANINQLFDLYSELETIQSKLATFG